MASVTVTAFATLDASRAEQRSLVEEHVRRTWGLLTRLCPYCGSTDHGRPLVRGTQLSLSYAPGLVLVATADLPVGVDVEVDGLVPPGFADMRAWTCAEAVLKATGEGLRRDPRTSDQVAAWTQSLPLDPPYVGTVALLGADEGRLSWRAGPAADVRRATDPAGA